MNKNNTLTVWKNGEYQVWGGADATYAQADPDYLVSIPLEEIDALKEAADSVKVSP